MFGWLFRRPDVPDRLEIVDYSYFLDGGTTTFVGIDPAGKERLIRLRHFMLRRCEFGWLYLGRYKVPRRSETERAILRLLRDCQAEFRARDPALAPGEQIDICKLDTPWNHLMVERIERVVEYVESDDYGKPVMYDDDGSD